MPDGHKHERHHGQTHTYIPVLYVINSVLQLQISETVYKNQMILFVPERERGREITRAEDVEVEREISKKGKKSCDLFAQSRKPMWTMHLKTFSICLHCDGAKHVLKTFMK